MAGAGAYRLRVVCVGRGQVRLEVAEYHNGAVTPLPCAEQPRAVLRLSMELPASFRLRLSGQPGNLAVVRWQLVPVTG